MPRIEVEKITPSRLQIDGPRDKRDPQKAVEPLLRLGSLDDAEVAKLAAEHPDKITAAAAARAKLWPRIVRMEQPEWTALVKAAGDELRALVAMGEIAVRGNVGEDPFALAA